jgi:hypothetical protein
MSDKLPQGCSDQAERHPLREALDDRLSHQNLEGSSDSSGKSIDRALKFLFLPCAKRMNNLVELAIIFHAE